jgi:hypothetical protein
MVADELSPKRLALVRTARPAEEAQEENGEALESAVEAEARERERIARRLRGERLMGRWKSI